MITTTASHDQLQLFSYIIVRDYGFAPNPFYGYCTLATCKGPIRGKAEVGDWVIGTGAKTQNRAGKLVYAMKVSETLTFDEYWHDPRFRCKRPQFQGSLKQAYGDNIYHHAESGKWLQERSHHSHPNGTSNPLNVVPDTRHPRVLISNDFAYWGVSAPQIPGWLRSFKGSQDICHDRQGYRVDFSDELVDAFERWFRSLNEKGSIGWPERWD